MSEPGEGISISPSIDAHGQRAEAAIVPPSFSRRYWLDVGRASTAIGKKVTAAMPVLLVLAAGFGGWWYYSVWNTGEVV